MCECKCVGVGGKVGTPQDGLRSDVCVQATTLYHVGCYRADAVTHGAVFQGGLCHKHTPILDTHTQIAYTFYAKTQHRKKLTVLLHDKCMRSHIITWHGSVRYGMQDHAPVGSEDSIEPHSHVPLRKVSASIRTVTKPIRQKNGGKREKKGCNFQTGTKAPWRDEVFTTQTNVSASRGGRRLQGI